MTYTVNGKFSKLKDIKISILQGGILGPILFLCYINDLQYATEIFTLMFADDTFCLNADEDIKTLIQNVNVQINCMGLWFRANKQAVNINKNKYIIFAMKGKKLMKILRPYYIMKMSLMNQSMHR